MKKLIILLLFFSMANAQEYTVSKFFLNPDGTLPDITVTVKGVSSGQIYNRTLDWVERYFKSSKGIVIETVKNKKIVLHFNNAPIFYRHNDYVQDFMQKYGEDITLTMSIEDGKYVNKYIHNHFTVEGRKVDLTMSNVINDELNFGEDGLADTDKQYEFNVTVLINRILMAITLTEMPD